MREQGPGGGISTSEEYVKELREFGNRLRRVWEEAKSRTGSPFTVDSVARKLAVSRRSLYAYFAGDSLVPTDTMEELLRLLDVPEAERGALRTTAIDLRVHRRGRQRDAGSCVRRRPVSPDLSVAPPSDRLAHVRDRRLRTRSPWTVGLELRGAGTDFFLGSVLRLTGRYGVAEPLLERAAQRHREGRDRLGEANALSFLGAVQSLAHRPGPGQANLNGALALYTDLESRHGQAGTWCDLGVLARRAGDHEVAARALAEALRRYQRLADGHGVGDTLLELGAAQRGRGADQSARESLLRARRSYDELGCRYGQEYAWLELGLLDGWATQSGDAPVAPAPLPSTPPGGGPAPERAARPGAVLEAADQAMDEALARWGAAGDTGSQLWALHHYATLLRAAGELDRARVRFAEVLIWARRFGSSCHEAAALDFQRRNP